jgi:hypothetical protein
MCKSCGKSDHKPKAKSEALKKMKEGKKGLIKHEKEDNEDDNKE